MKVEGSQLLRLDGKDFVSCPPIHVCDKSKVLNSVPLTCPNKNAHYL